MMNSEWCIFELLYIVRVRAQAHSAKSGAKVVKFFGTVNFSGYYFSFFVQKASKRLVISHFCITFAAFLSTHRL